MIINKYPFTDTSSFSDVNQILNDNESSDIEKNMENKVLDGEKLKMDKIEKIFWQNIIKNLKNNCYVCLFSSFVVSILLLFFKL